MIKVSGFSYNNDPKVFVAKISGKWILEHSRPSWRIDDPMEGFQRIVDQKRARIIASQVLDSGRSFPNAIIISCKDNPVTSEDSGTLSIKDESDFLIIDGQHRLYAQNFSNFNADFVCIIHVSLSEEDMARLFIEINDNQKRVPSSLRWDLIRLTKDDVDLPERRAVDIIYELVMVDRSSPVYQKVDLTGENNEITLKQGSLAPDISTLLKKKGHFRDLETYEKQKSLLLTYFTALKQWDEKGWHEGTSLFAQNRGLRVAIQLVNTFIEKIDHKDVVNDPTLFSEFLLRLNKEDLTLERIKALQGGAGMNEIKKMIEKQLWD
jgi:DNA sulfur modification protein DndB